MHICKISWMVTVQKNEEEIMCKQIKLGYLQARRHHGITSMNAALAKSRIFWTNWVSLFAVQIGDALFNTDSFDLVFLCFHCFYQNVSSCLSRGLFCLKLWQLLFIFLNTFTERSSKTNFIVYVVFIAMIRAIFPDFFSDWVFEMRCCF